MSRSQDQSNPARYDDILGEVARGIEDAQTDLRRRTKLVGKLEKLGGLGSLRVAMYYSRLEQSLTHDDILPFASMLKRIGKTENLDLIIHSGGGDGTAAEKLLDLCRKYCTGKLRVVVPLYAKSAATLIALGADEIIMGETSELGPIDAQVFVIVDNQPQQVSADHFIRARDEAIAKLSSSHPEEIQAAQIQLAQLSPAFLQQCLDQLRFAKDFARKQLRTHMLASEHAKDQGTWDDRIDKIVENLTASSKHLSHGRMITAADIGSDADLRHLKIRALENNDPYGSPWMSCCFARTLSCDHRTLGRCSLRAVSNWWQ